MELGADERIFLSAVYEAERSGRDTSLRRIRVETRGAVSADFNPRSVQEKYMPHGRLSLPAIFLLNPDDPIIKRTNIVAVAIRDILREDPDRTEFGAAELAKRLGIAEKDARLCLEYLTDLQLADSGNSSGDDPGWNTLYVNGDYYFEAFLNYRGIEECIHAALSKVRSPGTYTFVATDFPDTWPGKMTYRRNTAFIMMSMDPTNAQLEDVGNCFKEVCSSFEVHAERADDVEHSGMITELVLERIAQSEVLIADLSGERPNVYYEIGYAHALGKRPILYRTRGTRLHFDLAAYNVPEYRNVTELRELFTARLEAITGRKPTRR